jgi:hypothetical protein
MPARRRWRRPPHRSWLVSATGPRELSAAGLMILRADLKFLLFTLFDYLTVIIHRHLRSSLCADRIET